VRDSEFAASRPGRLKPLAYAGIALAAGIVLGAGLQWVFEEGTEEKVVAAPPAPPAVQVAALEKQVEPPPAPPPPPELLSGDQASRFGRYSTGGQRLLAERIAATRLALERVPDERYAIELFVTSNTDPARMERFLMRARDMVPLDEVLVIPMGDGKGGYRLRVALGEFASLAEALEADRRLPPKYQEAFDTAPRSFAELRGEI
jgi:hypothetical protein